MGVRNLNSNVQESIDFYLNINKIKKDKLIKQIIKS